MKNNGRKLQSARILNNEGDSEAVVKRRSNDYEPKKSYHAKLKQMNFKGQLNDETSDSDDDQ